MWFISSEAEVRPVALETLGAGGKKMVSDSSQLEGCTRCHVLLNSL